MPPPSPGRAGVARTRVPGTLTCGVCGQSGLRWTKRRHGLAVRHMLAETTSTGELVLHPHQRDDLVDAHWIDEELHDPHADTILEELGPWLQGVVDYALRQ